MLVVPKKRKHSDNGNVCIFCCEPENLIAQPKSETYLTVKRAAERRNDDVSKRFFVLYRSEEQKQTFSWHKVCLSTYVSEEKIKRREKSLEKQADTTDQHCEEYGPSTSSTRQCGRRNSKGMDMKYTCIICCQKTKKKDDKLFLLSERPAAEKFFLVAKDKRDHVYTRICTCNTVDDLFALEVRYHKSCLRDYTYIRRESGNTGGRPSQSLSRDVLQVTLNKVLAEIGTDFENKAFELTYLTNRIIEICGVEDIAIENRTTKNLLIDKFGEKVIFSQPSDRSKSPMVMMSNLSMEKMAERIRQVNNFDNSVRDIAVNLREEILNYKIQWEGYVTDDTLIEKSFNNFVLPPK